MIKFCKFSIVLFSFFIAFISNNLYAQTGLRSKPAAYAAIEARGEVYFSFSLQSPSLLPALSRIISISNISGNRVYAYANRTGFDEFLLQGIDYEVETAPSLLEKVSTVSDIKTLLEWDSYPTYEAYELLMNQFASAYPEICRLVTIGELPSGRKLLAVKISDNPDINENEPEFLYTSSIHGDETTGYILMLHLIDYLLNNYGKIALVDKLIDNVEIYINPLSNPDGTYKAGNNSVNGATRFNSASVDLNRNYPDPKVGAHPDGKVWQPETIAFMNFADNHHFTMSANFHGGAEVLNYPWDTWPRMPADYKWWIDVCRAYADTVHKYSPSSYLNDFDRGVTNGYAWYTLNGGRQDYMNYFRHCREVTIEISYTKLLPANQLLNHWNYNYRSLLNMIGESLNGLHGTITDSLTGQPLKALITLNGFDQDSSQVYSDAAKGDYHRLLKAGNYSVTCSAAGYIPKIAEITIVDKIPLSLDVKLAKQTTSLSDNESEKSARVNVYPNPATSGVIGISSPWNISEVCLYNLAGDLLSHANPHDTRHILNNKLAAGTYLVKISTGGITVNRKIEMSR